MDTTTSLDGIINEFEDWALRRRRQVNASVIEALLSARPAAFGSPRQVWRSDDVTPAVDAAVSAAPLVFLMASDTLEETLDAWFRFLRNTGRLGSGSADLAILRREARRAARTATDRAAFLVQDLVGCEVDPEEDCLDPDDPRHENIAILRDMGIDRFDVLARTWGTLPDPERAAELGWSSGYMARLRCVAAAISPSVELADMLFPSIGTAEVIVRSCPPGTFAGSAREPAPSDSGRSVLSSAFIGLWFDAQIAGLVETVDGRAVPGAAFGEGEETAVRRTLRAVRVGRNRIDDVLNQSEHGAGLVYLMARSLWGGDCSRVSVPGVIDATPWPWFVDRSEGDLLRAADNVREAVEAMVEVGVLEVDGDSAWLTPFGAWTVDSWLCRQFDPDAW